MLVIGFFSRALIRASLKSSYTLERANEKSRLAVAIFFCSAGKKPPTTKGVGSAVFGYSSTVVIDIIVERRGSYITDIEGSN